MWIRGMCALSVLVVEYWVTEGTCHPQDLFTACVLIRQVPPHHRTAPLPSLGSCSCLHLDSKH